MYMYTVFVTYMYKVYTVYMYGHDDSGDVHVCTCTLYVQAVLGVSSRGLPGSRKSYVCTEGIFNSRRGIPCTVTHTARSRYIHETVPFAFYFSPQLDSKSVYCLYQYVLCFYMFVYMYMCMHMCML